MNQINLKRNIAFTTSSQVITMFASFVANWYLARFLGPELRGQYVYLFTINSLVWLLLDLGVSKSLMYSLQRDKADPKALYSMSLVFFGISLLLSIVVFKLFGQKILGGNSYHGSVIFALSVYIALFQLHTRQKVMSIGMNRIKDYALLLTLPSLLFMFFILPLFWLFPANFRMQSSFLLYVALMVAISVFFHFRITEQIGFRFHWDLGLVKRSYALGFKAFLSEYMTIMMIRTDILLIKHLGGFADLGIYMLAINFIDIITVASNMIGVVILNKFAALNDDTASLAILRKIFVLMIAFNLVCILGMAALGRFVINFMYTSDYIGAYTAFMYLIPAVFGLTLGALFNTFLWSKGFPIFTIIAPAISAVAKLIIGLFLIPRYGYLGAAISSSIVYPAWLAMLMIWYFYSHPQQKVSSLMVRKEDFNDMGMMLQTLVSRFRRAT
ncbi:MAG: oligosaccharide flippase family protein [Candidatus Cloacimonadaceae bacterium]|jgi:O-antigen/teichoic acid export membrane protein|nr:oligosaccharide flippase family protein [Candidatus Cloacimonadaceae bacterium]